MHVVALDFNSAELNPRLSAFQEADLQPGRTRGDQVGDHDGEQKRDGQSGAAIRGDETRCGRGNRRGAHRLRALEGIDFFAHWSASGICAVTGASA